MAQSLSSVSYTNNNAAKDDIVGGTIDQDGFYTFTINSLLSNDPGGAAKLDLTKQFFFGEGVHDQQGQAAYMTAHHIELVDQATGTYRVLAGEDFQYSVQIGNKGTWSLAGVDVKDAPPVAAPHLGGALFTENFDETPVQVFSDPFGAPGSASIDLTKFGWTDTQHTDDFGFTALSEVVFSGKFGPTLATSGERFLDTQNTPGQIDISHAFTDSTAAIDGKTATLSFDIGKFIIDWNGSHYETNSNESFEFQIDGNTVKSFVASQFNDASMHHFDVDIMASAYDPGVVDHILSLVNTSDAASTIGFAVDSVVIHDWIV